MSTPHDISEELLFAYVDGELDDAQRARVEAALAHDPALAATVAQHRQLREQLGAHFDAVLQEPLPGRLRQTLQPPAAGNVADIGAARATRASREPRRWSPREWGAIAATLLLGVLLGIAWRGGTREASLVADATGLRAGGALASALSERAADVARPGAAVHIGLSLRTNTGEYCRSFELAGGTAGLACHRDDHWAVDIVAREAASPAEGEFRQAGSALPEALRMAIEQRIAGEPLTAAEEIALIRQGWRDVGVSGQGP